MKTANLKRRNIALSVTLFSIIFLYGFSLSAQERESREIFRGPIRITKEIRADHVFKGGTHMVKGAITAPTPCYDLSTEVLILESSPEEVVINFNLKKPADSVICIQVIAEKPFLVEFQASEEARIKATLDGEPVTLNLDRSADSAGRNLIKLRPGDESGKIREAIRESKERGKDIREAVDIKSDRRSDVAKKQQSRLEEDKFFRIEAYIERVVRRIQAAADRLSNIADRIDSRIEVFEREGLGLDGAMELTAEARVRIEAVNTNLSELSGIVEEMRESETPRTIFENLKEAVKEMKANLKEARDFLKSAIEIIKSEREEKNGTEGE